MKITLHGPYRREKRKIFDPDILFAIIMGIVGAVVTILLICLAISMVKDPYKDNGRTYIPRRELHRIQRYHGTRALKIVGEKVWIWRNGDWLKIRRKHESS